MQQLEYKKLNLIKEFPRWRLVNINEDDFFQLKFEFQENYRKNKCKPPPTYNILQYVIFDTRQGPFDLYYPKVVGYDGDMLVSNRLLSILREYNLQEHITFPGIKYTFKDDERNDMNFLVLYDDYSKYIDYAKSTYQLVVSDFTFRKDEFGNLKKEAILKDNIKFNSREEYYFNMRKRNRLRNDPVYVFKHLYCRECINLDMFYFKNEEGGVYLSPRLVKRLEKEKIKGVDYWNNFTFDFVG